MQPWNSAANRDRGGASDGADTEETCTEPGVIREAVAMAQAMVTSAGQPVTSTGAITPARCRQSRRGRSGRPRRPVASFGA
jgi:hypothetical protein